MQDKIDKINNIFRKIQKEYVDSDKELCNFCDLKMYNIKKEVNDLLNYILLVKYGY